MRKVLHVGCGQKTLAQMPPGFRDGDWEEVRFDVQASVRPHIVGSMTDMSAVADNSMDALYSSHNIEHVYPHQVDGVLREFLRVLKPEGFAVVTCPDLQEVARHVAEGRLEEPLYQSPSGPVSALDIFYGHNASIAKGEVAMAHRTGFTGKSLGDHAGRAGFACYGIRTRPRFFDIWLVAAKLQRTAEELQVLMASYALD